MRQIIASAVIAASVFAAASPTPAQRTPRRQRPINRPTVTATPTIQTGGDPLAQFDSIQAVTSGLGVTIQWTMKEEKRVAIYQVFRTDSRGRVPVGSPVIGSAGKTRQEVMYGESYSAYDPQGTAGSVYDIEAIGMSGGLKADSWQVPASMDKNASLMAMAAEETAAASATNSQIESMTPTDAARPEAAVPNLTIQQWVASQPGVKIGVKADGLYRVTRAELDAAGLSTIAGSGNSANWKLFESGNEQAMLVGANDQYIEFIGRGLDTMESDTRMYYLVVDSTPGARVQTHTLRSNVGTMFAGNFRNTVQMKERVNYVDTLFNGDVENWWGGAVTSSATLSENVTLPNVDPAGPDALFTIAIQGFSSTSHDLQVSVNGHVLSNDITGQYQQAFSKALSVPASFLLSGTNTIGLLATASGDISLFDNVKVVYTQKYSASQNAVTIYTGGRRKVALDGFSSPTVSTVTIASGSQVLGAATTGIATASSSTPGILRFSSPAYTGVAGGSSAARVTVSRVYGSTGGAGATLSLTNGTAVGGSSCGSGADYVNPGPIAVSFASGEISESVDIPVCPTGIGKTFNVNLTGATGATLAGTNIRMFDLSKDAPQLVGGLSGTQNGNNFGVVLPIYRAATLYAIDDAYALQAKSVTANTPSTLSSASNPGADMVIISYSDPSFIAASNNWADYRRSPAGGSFNVKIVDVADIYDEFGYGVRSANAINGFLRFAYQSWQTRPKYVLLVGDASFDPRNYEGRLATYGDWDLVPTKLVELVFQQSGSDEALADFNGDGLAEIPIGRIPSRLASTITQLQAKMQAQESVNGMSFGRGAVFVNDAPKGYDFASMNQTLRNELSNISSATFVSATDANPSQGVINALNTGPYIVNYAGHGAAGLWADPVIFQNSSVSQLSNANNLSIYTLLTCFNGYFISSSPGDCLAETLLKSSTGGASLVWASTTETTPDIQLIMGRQFYHQLNAGTYNRIGDLIKDAKAALVDNQGHPLGTDVRYSWALLGDPATQIRP